MTHAISAFFASISETKQAIAAMASVLAVGILIGGVGTDVLTETPEIARMNAAVLDSIVPVVMNNQESIVELRAVDSMRDRQMTRVEEVLDEIRLNQCLTLSELRGDMNADRCRAR